MKHSNHWQLYEAKNKFTEVIKTARDFGPQFITVRGQEEAVILSVSDFQKIFQQGKDLVSFFKDSPIKEGELAFEREQDLAREVEL